MKRKLGGETKREGRGGSVVNSGGNERASFWVRWLERLLEYASGKGRRKRGIFWHVVTPGLYYASSTPRGVVWVEVEWSLQKFHRRQLSLSSLIPKFRESRPFSPPFFFLPLIFSRRFTPIPLTHFVGREILRKISSKNSPNIRPNWNFKIFARIKVGQSAWIIYERLIGKSGMKRKKKRKIYVCFDFRSSFIDFFFFVLSHIRQNTSRTSNFIYS